MFYIVGNELVIKFPEETYGEFVDRIESIYGRDIDIKEAEVI